MKIKEIHLKSFKRFTDLQISGLSDTIKLVVLLGPNGCGKSSVFDAIYAFAMKNYRPLGNQSWEYYAKESVQMTPDTQGQMRIGKQTEVIFHGKSPTNPEEWKKIVYPRCK